MLKTIILIVSILFITGCTVKTAPMTEYNIKTNVKVATIKSSKYADKSLKVSQAFSPNSLMSLKMNYVQGDFKEYYYNQSQWSQSPNKAVTMQMIKMLRKTALFSSVQVFKSRSKSDLILEISVEDFMQYFDKNLLNSYVNIEMTLTLINSKDNSIIASKVLKSKLKSKTLDAQGGVEALNEALEDILLQSVKWLGDISK